MSYSKIVENFYLGNQDAAQTIKKVDLIISVGCSSRHVSSHSQNIV